MPNAMIEVDNLNRSVDGKAILRGVSLTLETGCTLGLIGRTGAGKTTLLRCMLGLGFADSGTALILGDVATQ
ncbi:MAG: superfamily binding cassette transporter, protein, partial [Rhodocyclales bacterium]|nr:superfamily binding cassette transporter, protein [Rhodocyclales bacterium]